MIKKLISICLVIVLACSLIFVVVACESTPDLEDGECQHALVHTSAVGADCTKNGNIEYWQCSKCNKYFSDSKAKNEIAANSIIIAAKHTLTHNSANIATCTEDGNFEYWQCSKCYKTFADENATNEIDISETIIESKGHVVGNKWESDENGHWKVCSACTQAVDSAPHQLEQNVCSVCEYTQIDYDNLTPETMTEEQRQTIITNIMTALERNINDTIGKSVGGQLKKIIAIDFEENYIFLFMNYLTFENKDTLALFRFPMKETVDYKALLTNTIVSANKMGSGEPLCTILSTPEVVEQTEAVFEKLKPEEDRNCLDIVSLEIISSGMSQCKVTLYTLGKLGLTTITVSTAMGLNGKDTIEKGILNGVEGTDYTITEQENYEFSKKSLYDFNGLNFQGLIK